VKLEGKTAIISGACGGIGRAIAERYAEEGATVVVTDRNRDRAARVAAEIGHGAYAVALDVTSEPSIAALIDEVDRRSRTIDILVNNAAVFDMAPVLDVTRASYDLLFDVNVKGLFFTLQAVAAHMVKRGGGGKIINISSQAGRRGEALVSMYCATKAAVISLTQSAGLDLIKHRINVNCIAPGVIDTPMWDRVDALFAQHENRPIGEKKRLVGEAVPYGRMGVPDDQTGAAVFLASSDSDYVVAQTLNVDGGNRMN
jgi:NAD(P)-dependent dehydrogenase (short-subunit alcohol dehydrogenase family)